MAGPMISGPMPSPGRRTTFGVIAGRDASNRGWRGHAPVSPGRGRCRAREPVVVPRRGRSGEAVARPTHRKLVVIGRQTWPADQPSRPGLLRWSYAYANSIARVRV